VRRGKALATIVRQATVTDASGNSIDFDALFGPVAQTEEQAPEVVEAETAEVK
jgi:trigger factor